MSRHAIWKVGLGVCLALTGSARANPTFTYTNGDLSAQVIFAQDDSELVVTLENFATAGVLVPTDVLTGVFFNIAGVTLDPLSAVLTPGSSVLFTDSAVVRDGNPDPEGDGLDSNDEVGGEWAYRGNLNPGDVLSGATHVIGSAGFGGFLGPHDLFPGDNLDDAGDSLDDPTAPDGLNYGIVGVGGVDMVDGNTPVTGAEPLIMNGVIFRFALGGLAEDFNIDNAISAVQFNYGTDVSVIPLPSAVYLGLVGFGAIAGVRRRLL